MFNRIGYRDRAGNLPLLISITSKGDTATHGWFPVGTFFPNLFAHREYHWGHHYDRASDETDQNVYLTKTPGNNPLLFTHCVDDKLTKEPPALSAEAVARLRVEVQQGDCAITEPINPAFEYNLGHVTKDWIFATSLTNNPEHFKWWQVHPYRPDKRTPYWILQVPKAIIPNHTPIFTPEGRAMMAALFKIANPSEESRAFIQTAQTD